MKKKITKEEFLKKAHEVHGDKYDYSKVEYVNSQIKVCIICPIHGEFWIAPTKHIHGRGCQICGYDRIRKYPLDSNIEFINEIRQKHGDKYDYSKIQYKGITKKVCLICPIHGEIWIKAERLLTKDTPCPFCASKYYKTSLLKTTDEFIRDAMKVHGDKYDYSQVNYKGQKIKVEIICPIHGSFWQAPYTHLKGSGCQACKFDKLHQLYAMSKEQFIQKSQEIHGNKYDYSKVEYVNNHTKVCIICPIHGEFWMQPNNHTLSHQGCPACNESHLEREMRLFLDKTNISYTTQKKFPWLGRQSLDFYLPQYNIAIECQGEQHFGFSSSSKFFGEEKYKKIIQYDKNKYRLCKENGVKLLYYSNLGIEYPYEVFEDKEKLLEEIKKYSQKNLEV